MTLKTAARRGLTASERWLIVGSLVVAVLLLVAALVVPMIAGWSENERPSWWTWLDAVLINAGAAIALVAPIEWFSSRLRREVEESEERQDERVQAVREESASRLDELVERVESLAELERRVEQQLDEVVAADHALFRSVAAADATAEVTARALTRAAQRRLISARGVRVPYNGEDGLHVVFGVPSGGTPMVHLRVTDEREQQVITIVWRGPMTAEKMLLHLGTGLRNQGIDARPSAQSILDGLSETLVHADRHDFARPIVQYFSPQWALTDTAIVASGTGSGWGYEITHARPDRIGMYEHVRTKRWLHENSFEAAWQAAQNLFPLTETQSAYTER